jgi:hypothetical protein
MAALANLHPQEKQNRNREALRLSRRIEKAAILGVEGRGCSPISRLPILQPGGSRLSASAFLFSED